MFIFSAGVLAGTFSLASPDLQLTATVQPTSNLEIGHSIAIALQVENVGTSVSMDRLSGAIGEAFVAFPFEVVDSSPCGVVSLDIDPPAFHFFWNSKDPLAPGESESCTVTLEVIREPILGEYRMNVFTDSGDDLNPDNDSREFSLSFGSPKPIPAMSPAALLLYLALVIVFAIRGTLLRRSRIV